MLQQSFTLLLQLRPTSHQLAACLLVEIDVICLSDLAMDGDLKRRMVAHQVHKVCLKEDLKLDHGVGDDVCGSELKQYSSELAGKLAAGAGVKLADALAEAAVEAVLQRSKRKSPTGPTAAVKSRLAEREANQTSGSAGISSTSPSARPCAEHLEQDPHRAR